MPKKHKKLTLAEKRLASRYIAEEVKTRQYPHKQAIAIGISRARAGLKKTKRKQLIKSIMSRYK